jgi:hypothetical protein
LSEKGYDYNMPGQARVHATRLLNHITARRHNGQKHNLKKKDEIAVQSVRLSAAAPSSAARHLRRSPLPVMDV